MSDGQTETGVHCIINLLIPLLSLTPYIITGRSITYFNLMHTQYTNRYTAYAYPGISASAFSAASLCFAMSVHGSSLLSSLLIP